MAYSFSMTGQGHYGLMPKFEQSPGMSSANGQHAAINQSLRLQIEAKKHDKASFITELSLFSDPGNAYLGDVTKPRNCEEYARTTTRGSQAGGECSDKANQNTREPGYKSFSPAISKAYLRYGFDMFILEAGRRGRQHGLGIYLDEGNKPFDVDKSIFLASFVVEAEYHSISAYPLQFTDEEITDVALLFCLLLFLLRSLSPALPLCTSVRAQSLSCWGLFVCPMGSFLLFSGKMKHLQIFSIKSIYIYIYRCCSRH